MKINDERISEHKAFIEDIHGSKSSQYSYFLFLIAKILHISTDDK